MTPERTSLRIETERKLIHLALLVIPVAAWLLLDWLPQVVRPLLWLGFGVGLTLDLARRRHRDFRGWIDGRVGHLIRPHEAWHPLGSTLLLFGLALAFTLFRPTVALAATVFLIVGDALAALVGIRYGRVRIRGNKTLEGAVACCAACLVAGAAIERLDPSLRPALWSAGAGVAAVAELFTPRGYDNVAVPLLAGAAMSLTGRGF